MDLTTQALDCKMSRTMRVLGHDVHTSAIATFMQQMIPHRSMSDT